MGPPVPALVPERDRSPEESLTVAQQLAGLQQAMSALPRSLAEPLVLHLDEVPDADIAERLNITKEVVRKRRQMARDWLAPASALILGMRDVNPTESGDALGNFAAGKAGREGRGDRSDDRQRKDRAVGFPRPRWRTSSPAPCPARRC